MFTSHFAKMDEDGRITTNGQWSPTISAHFLLSDKFTADVTHFEQSVLHHTDWYCVSVQTSPYSDDPNGGQVNLYLSPGQLEALKEVLL